MQAVVFDKPYRFIPPVTADWWPALIQRYLSRLLRKSYGIATVECRKVDRLRQSLRAGHGILLAPNHCRMSDPLVLGKLAREAGTHLFAMASWHLFMQSPFMTFMIRRMGAFSVYREGLDRQALNMAIDVLDQARRPLVIFPEGSVSRHNDELLALLDGTAFIARSAAKRRQKRTPAGQVVVHPVAIRYYFRGNLEQAVEPVLAEIEHRLAWQRQTGVGLVERIDRIAEALLSLKEVEYFGAARPGDKYERALALVDHLLVPLEREWDVAEREMGIVARVKRLRSAIVPELVNGQLSEAERERRWRELADCYLAQQMSLYPEDYIQPGWNIPEHVLETVERFEEDLTDQVRIHGPFHVVIEVGEAIAVSPERDRKAEPDAVMQAIEEQLKGMLASLSRESTQRDFSSAEDGSRLHQAVL